MNERIRELAERASDTSEYDLECVTDKFLEDFAELIVQECAEIADNADATREKWQSIGKFVREHFGVEE
jgi:hypothetical protein